MRRILVLIKGDLKNIFREWILVYALVVPLIILLATRFFIPSLSEYIFERFGLNLEIYYPLITGYFMLFVTLLLGMVAGFLLLDEKDNQIMMVLMVTPLSRKNYIFYRITMPLIIGFMYSLAIIPILGITKINLIDINILYIILIAFMCALEGSMVALFLANYAQNKVEGLALSKGIGLLLLAPLGHFILGRWRLIAGVIPTYWPVNSFALAVQAKGAYCLYIIVGLLFHIILFSLLLSKFKENI